MKKEIEFEPQWARLEKPKPKERNVLLEQLAFCLVASFGMALAILLIGLLVNA